MYDIQQDNSLLKNTLLFWSSCVLCVYLEKLWPRIWVSDVKCFTGTGAMCVCVCLCVCLCVLGIVNSSHAPSVHQQRQIQWFLLLLSGWGRHRNGNAQCKMGFQNYLAYKQKPLSFRTRWTRYFSDSDVTRSNHFLYKSYCSERSHTVRVGWLKTSDEEISIFQSGFTN